MQANRVSSGAEASSRSNGACGAGQAAGAAWQQQWRRPHSASKLVATQRQGSGASSRRRGLLVARAAAEPEAPQRSGALVPDRQGYRTFQLDGCEFLIAESADGKLDLQDVYVTTDVSSSSGNGHLAGGDEQPRPAPSYQRPTAAEGITSTPQEYQAVPWYNEYNGDIIKNIPGKTWVWRYYLVPIVAHEPFLQLSFDEIYVLDGKTASLQPCEVHRLAPADTPPRDLRLRIRDEVVTIDTISSIPSWEQSVLARIGGVPALSQLEIERVEEYLNALEAARQLGTIDETEFETAHDMHWLAGMQAGSAGVEALGGAYRANGQEEGEGADAFPAEAEEDVMGGWDKEMFEDLMQEFDDESDEADFEDFDSPATDY